MIFTGSLHAVFNIILEDVQGHIVDMHIKLEIRQNNWTLENDPLCDINLWIICKLLKKTSANKEVNCILLLLATQFGQ